VGRTEELAKLDAEIQAATARRAKIAENYTTFANRIATQIDKILKDADVFDVIRALEVGRDKRRSDDQAQADALGQQLDEMAKMRAALVADEPVTPAS